MTSLDETAALNDTLDQMDLIEFSNYFIPKSENIHTFQVHMEHFVRYTTLGHKTRLNKFHKIEMILSIFSDHNGMELEINYKKRTEKHTNTWRLNDMLLNNKWVCNEIKGEIKDTLR